MPLALNPSALNDLEDLGGRDFLREVTMQFVDDAVAVLASLAEAVEQEDVGLFHDKAHALRSCAANVGAIAVYDLCLQWRDITLEDVRQNGTAKLAALDAAFIAYRTALLVHFESSRISQDRVAA